MLPACAAAITSHVQDKPQKWQQRGGGRRAAAALVRKGLLRLRRLFQRHVQRADGVFTSGALLAAALGRGRARRVLLRFLCGRGGGVHDASHDEDGLLDEERCADAEARGGAPGQRRRRRL